MLFEIYENILNSTSRTVRKKSRKTIPSFVYKKAPLRYLIFQSSLLSEAISLSPSFQLREDTPWQQQSCKIFPKISLVVLWHFPKASAPYGLCFDILYPGNSKEKKKYCQCLARFRYFSNLGQKEKEMIILAKIYFLQPWHSREM